MRELNINEIKTVEGGVIPLIVAGFYVSGKALAGGFALGVAAGSIWALLD